MILTYTGDLQGAAWGNTLIRCTISDSIPLSDIALDSEHTDQQHYSVTVVAYPPVDHHAKNPIMMLSCVRQTTRLTVLPKALRRTTCDLHPLASLLRFAKLCHCYPPPPPQKKALNQRQIKLKKKRVRAFIK